MNELKLINDQINNIKKNISLFQKYNVKYIEFNIVDDIFYKNLKNIIFIDPIDHILEKKLNNLSNCNIIENIQFLLSKNEIIENKHKFMKNNKYYNCCYCK